MILSGIQKMSLVDFPGKVACTVFTGGCDLRCPFCHNAELLTAPTAALTTEELLSFLKKRTGLLEGVVVTGGEPCLHKDLPELLSAIRELGFKTKLDTNGSFPDLLDVILSRHLIDYAAIDIKNAPDRYAMTAGVSSYNMEPLKKTLSLLVASGIDFELRTTVVHPLHDEASFTGIRDFLLGLFDGKAVIPHYYLQFFTDRDTVPFAGLQAPTKEEMKIYADILSPVSPSVMLRGE